MMMGLLGYVHLCCAKGERFGKPPAALAAKVVGVESWRALVLKTCVIGEEKFLSCQVHSVMGIGFDLLLVVGDFKGGWGALFIWLLAAQPPYPYE